MKKRLSRRQRITALAGITVVAAGSLTWAGMSASAAPKDHPPAGGTVLQTNLVSDLPGAATVTDPNLVNPWGISESSGSPFWLSDNNSGLSTLYQVPGASSAPVTTLGLVVTIPTPVSVTGGAASGTVFNSAAAGAFTLTGVDKTGAPASASAAFLFDTEDGTIVGWNPGVNPAGSDPATAGTHAVIAVDNSGNNFTNPDPNRQTGAVYKGLALATSGVPIISGDGASTALLYGANFRAGTVDVYDAKFKPATGLSAGAFRDAGLPRGYAPFGIQELNGKIYVTYARQDASKHDDLAGPGRGFVDVFNTDGTPGLPGGKVRLVSRGELDSPWGLAIAPTGFAGITAPSGDPVLLVGNFGDGFINAFDATTGAGLGPIKDPDGEPIQISKLWALRPGNGGRGGLANTVYFTAGPFDEAHGLFGSLTTAAPGSPEGPAEQQWVTANSDVVQLDLTQLQKDLAGGASAATLDQDTRTLNADVRQLTDAERDFTADSAADAK
jgi:uncharacterized protein (TIGR03118 family)